MSHCVIHLLDTTVVVGMVGDSHDLTNYLAACTLREVAWNFIDICYRRGCCLNEHPHKTCIFFDEDADGVFRREFGGRNNIHVCHVFATVETARDLEDVGVLPRPNLKGSETPGVRRDTRPGRQGEG